MIKKKKPAAKTKTKSSKKTKAKPIARKKAKPVKKKSKAKSAVASKAKKSAVKVKPTRLQVSKKKKISAVKTKPKQAAVAKSKKPVQRKIVTPPPIEKIPGEDLHLIPVAGETTPVTMEEAKKIEHVFHQRDEVAFHQENQKAKEALAKQNNAKRFFRHRGG